MYSGDQNPKYFDLENPLNFKRLILHPEIKISGSRSYEVKRKR